MSMNKHFGNICCIKIGQTEVQQIFNEKQKEMISGIRKKPVKKAMLLKMGFMGDQQADTIHHGGENKSVLFFSAKTYSDLNHLFNISFQPDGIAYYGENLVVSDINEENICVGDELRIGNTVRVQITQPRQPCWKLSENTCIPNMAEKIFENGYTGWYAKVLEEGEIDCDDSVVLLNRTFPTLTIKSLNSLMVNPNIDKSLAQKALDCNALGHQFKKSLQKRINGSNEMLLYQVL